MHGKEWGHSSLGRHLLPLKLGQPVMTGAVASKAKQQKMIPFPPGHLGKTHCRKQVTILEGTTSQKDYMWLSRGASAEGPDDN